MKLIGASIDVETTGLLEGVHEIVEFTVLLHDKDFNPLDRFTSRMRPMRPELADREALQVNGLDLKELMGEPTPPQVRNAFFQWCDEVVFERKIFPLGHNYNGFDKQFLKNFLGEHYESYFFYKGRDSFTLAQGLIDANLMSVKSTSLGNLCKFFKIDHVAHTSYGDTKATLTLYKKLLEKIKG